MNGEVVPGGSNHTNVGGTSHWGKKLGDAKPDPTTFMKKKVAETRMGSTTKGEYTGKEKRRPPVPKKEEKPILGLTSDKNYIIANAVENILVAPKVKKKRSRLHQEKGLWQNAEMPKYLQKIKK